MPFRASGPITTVHSNLGLLSEFRGRWVGDGFNLTARPDFDHEPPFFLELNGTVETLDFAVVAGGIPNRGSTQPDAELHGLRYLQQVTDCALNAGIHVEPGLWVHVPSTKSPPAGESYVRHATIPHGNALLAQSTFFTELSAPPTIKPVNSTPFTGGIPDLNADPTTPVSDPAYLQQYLEGVLPKCCLPPALKAADTIKDPTEVLRAKIMDQRITKTVVIEVSTVPAGGIVNIPFLVKNANATRMDAIFWVETVEQGGCTYMQLQYVQRVILDFIEIHWPHISVATLVKQ